MDNEFNNINLFFTTLEKMRDNDNNSMAINKVRSRVQVFIFGTPKKANCYFINTNSILNHYPKELSEKDFLNDVDEYCPQNNMMSLKNLNETEIDSILKIFIEKYTVRQHFSFNNKDINYCNIIGYNEHQLELYFVSTLLSKDKYLDIKCLLKDKEVEFANLSDKEIYKRERLSIDNYYNNILKERNDPKFEKVKEFFDIMTTQSIETKIPYDTIIYIFKSNNKINCYFVSNMNLTTYLDEYKKIMREGEEYFLSDIKNYFHENSSIKYLKGVTEREIEIIIRTYIERHSLGKSDIISGSHYYICFCKYNGGMDKPYLYMQKEVLSLACREIIDKIIESKPRDYTKDEQIVKYNKPLEEYFELLYTAEEIKPNQKKLLLRRGR